MVLRSCLARCLVTAIDDCPPIADGEGSVVTARFVTGEVHVVASVDVLGADGTVETITGRPSTLCGQSIARNGCR
jgi:hypothetical protein